MSDSRQWVKSKCTECTKTQSVWRSGELCCLLNQAGGTLFPTIVFESCPNQHETSLYSRDRQKALDSFFVRTLFSQFILRLFPISLPSKSALVTGVIGPAVWQDPEPLFSSLMKRGKKEINLRFLSSACSSVRVLCTFNYQFVIPNGGSNLL